MKNAFKVVAPLIVGIVFFLVFKVDAIRESGHLSWLYYLPTLLLLSWRGAIYLQKNIYDNKTDIGLLLATVATLVPPFLPVYTLFDCIFIDPSCY